MLYAQVASPSRSGLCRDETNSRGSSDSLTLPHIHHHASLSACYERSTCSSAHVRSCEAQQRRAGAQVSLRLLSCLSSPWPSRLRPRSSSTTLYVAPFVRPVPAQTPLCPKCGACRRCLDASLTSPCNCRQQGISTTLYRLRSMRWTTSGRRLHSTTRRTPRTGTYSRMNSCKNSRPSCFSATRIRSSTTRARRHCSSGSLKEEAL